MLLGTWVNKGKKEGRGCCKPRPCLLLPPRSSSGSESSLTGPYVRLPLRAQKLKLIEVNGELPLGGYRVVVRRFDMQLVRRRVRTLAYDPHGLRGGERSSILPKLG